MMRKAAVLIGVKSATPGNPLAHITVCFFRDIVVSMYIYDSMVDRFYNSFLLFKVLVSSLFFPLSDTTPGRVCDRCTLRMDHHVCHPQASLFAVSLSLSLDI